MNQSLTEPLSLAEPSTLGETSDLSRFALTTIHWGARTRIGFVYHWLREVTGNRLEGEFGLPVATPLTVALEVRLRAPARAAVSLGSDAWRRLRCHKMPGGTGSVPAIEVAAENLTPLPRGVDELLAVLAGVPGQATVAGQALESYPTHLALPKELAKPLAKLFGKVRSEQDFAEFQRRLATILSFRDALYETAVAALEKKCSAEVAGRYQSAAEEDILLDCSFASTEQGQRLYRDALRGEFTGLEDARCEDCRLAPGLLTGIVGELTDIELHLPLVHKRCGNNRMEVLKATEPETDENGRISAVPARGASQAEYRNLHQTALILIPAIPFQGKRSAEAFSIAFTDHRRLCRPQLRYGFAPLLTAYGFEESADELLAAVPEAREDINVALTLSVPSSILGAWLETPAERSVACYEGLSRVSRAVQSSLRRWLPYIYFSNLDRFEDRETAYFMLVYQASRPFSRKARADFTYDPMNLTSLNLAFRNASGDLAGVLWAARQMLLETGGEESAEAFAAKLEPKILRAVKRGNRCFRTLLAADAACVRQFIKLANRGREIRRELETSPESANHYLYRFAAEIAKNFRLTLKHIHSGQDFTALGSLLLVEAVSALSDAWAEQTPVEAVLRLSVAGEPAAPEVVVANRARQRRSSRPV